MAVDWGDSRRLEARAFEVLQRRDDRALLEVAGDLAGTIRGLLANGPVWEQLESGSREAPTRRQLTQLLLVDWRALLRPVLESEELGQLDDELVDAISQATEEGSWGETRELLGWLADRLEDDVGAPPPPQEKKRWRGIRDRVGFAVSAVRRVRIGSLLAKGIGPGAATGAGTAAAALIFGVPFGPAAPIAAVVAGLGTVAASELRRGYQEERQGRDGRHLDGVLDDEALLPATGGRMGAEIAAVKELVTARLPVGGPDAEEGVLPALWRLRLWAAQVGARLAAAWPFVAGQVGEKGLRALEAVTRRLVAFKASLGSMAKAAERDDGPGILAEVPVLDAALEKIEAALNDFAWTLADAGFGTPHP